MLRPRCNTMIARRTWDLYPNTTRRVGIALPKKRWRPIDCFVTFWFSWLPSLFREDFGSPEVLLNRRRYLLVTPIALEQLPNDGHWWNVVGHLMIGATWHDVFVGDKPSLLDTLPCTYPNREVCRKRKKKSIPNLCWDCLELIKPFALVDFWFLI